MVEAVCKWIWELDSADPWEGQLSATDRMLVRYDAHSLLNAIAEAGAGNVGVRQPSKPGGIFAPPDPHRPTHVTPAPLEEK